MKCHRIIFRALDGTWGELKTRYENYGDALSKALDYFERSIDKGNPKIVSVVIGNGKPWNVSQREIFMTYDPRD